MKQAKVKREVQDHSQMLLSSIADCSAITMDLNGCILSWNEGAQLLSGYTAEEIIGQNISCLYTKKDRESGRAGHDREGARKKGRFEHAGWRVRKDGEEFFSNVVTTVLTDANGTVCAFGEVSRDLTAQRLSEQNLREQLEIINLSHETIMILGLDGAIQFWNNGAQEMYGFSQAEALGQKSHELLRTEFPTSLDDIRLLVLTKGRWDGELVHHSRSGEAMTVSSRWVVRRDGGGQPVSFLEIDRGINERKNAEQKRLQDKADRELQVKERILELAASEKLLLSKTLEIAKSDEDKELKIQERIVELALSEELLRSKVLEIEDSDEQRELRVQERIVELAASEALLRSKTLEIETSDQEREIKVQERIVELAASEKLLRSKTLEIETSDQEREIKVQERIVELAASEKLLRSKTLKIEKSDEQRELRVQERVVELAASEKLLRSKTLEIEEADKERELKVQQRIVELAASEKLLRSKKLEIEKSDEQRELRVQERIVELAASEELLRSKMMELERSNEELQQFAYVCSHDLQEPLRVISNYTQLLSKRYSGQLDEKADLFIAFAVDAAKRMQILINDLLAYSRLQTREKKIGPVDCNTVLRMALANLEILLSETGAKVNYGSLPTITGDQSQLLQLFQNLISNALKFRSTGDIIIDISARREGEEWFWAVRDNGIGFDIQFEERIFLIFQRLHTKEEYSGSGIGLAVCKKIVLRHGGRIWAESELGKGATFNFTLPAQIKENQNG